MAKTPKRATPRRTVRRPWRPEEVDEVARMLGSSQRNKRVGRGRGGEMALYAKMLADIDNLFKKAAASRGKERARYSREARLLQRDAEALRLRLEANNQNSGGIEKY